MLLLLLDKLLARLQVLLRRKVGAALTVVGHL
jgi:hypothetical protein